jgi:hypothetical protein
MDKYEWYPQHSADQAYPMEIVKGDFIFPDGNSIYIPSGGTFNYGWGKDPSVDIAGPDLKPIPLALDITWFSYTEDKFYSGLFKLPREQMNRLFEKGYIEPNRSRHTTYKYIMVGVAPAGEIAVWLQGDGFSTEVAYFSADEVEVDWKHMLDNPDISRQQWIDMTLEDDITEEQWENLKKNGIPVGRWQRFRPQYNLQFKFTGGTPDNMWISSFNGESDYLSFPPLNEPKPTRAALKDIMLEYSIEDGRYYALDVVFDEEETLAAFEKFESIKTDDQLTLTIELLPGARMADISLQNNKFAYEFEKHTQKTYPIRPPEKK